MAACTGGGAALGEGRRIPGSFRAGWSRAGDGRGFVTMTGVSSWVGGTPFNRGGKSRGGGSRSDGQKTWSFSGSLGDNLQRIESRDNGGEAVELPGFMTQGVCPQPPQM